MRNFEIDHSQNSARKKSINNRLVNHLSYVINQSIWYYITYSFIHLRSVIQQLNQLHDFSTTRMELIQKKHFSITFTCLFFCQDLVQMHLLIRRSSSAACYTSVSMYITSKAIFSFFFLARCSRPWNSIYFVICLFSSLLVSIGWQKIKKGFFHLFRYVYIHSNQRV